MIRRSLSACLGAVALVGILSLPARAAAKPPDLPMNETITVAPKAAPQNESPANSLYEALPDAMPTPTLYQLHPTARRTLVGSMLFGINPVLGWLPIEKALDAPHDHPPRVASDDVFVDMPHNSGGYRISGLRSELVEIDPGHGDWLTWLVTHWGAWHDAFAPGQNKGHLEAIEPHILKPLDTPHDHRQRVSGDDMLAGLPRYEVDYFVHPGDKPPCRFEIDWLKWRAIWHAVPAPEQNEGCVYEVALDDAIDTSIEETGTPGDHPQPRMDDNVLSDIPCDTICSSWGCVSGDWWKWLISHWTARQQPLTPEQNEGYLQTVATGMDFAYRAANDPPASECETVPPTIETLPIPQEDSDITCPYLRQQMTDRHVCQLADPQIGRDVLDNLERLKQADNLIEMAKTLAHDGCIVEAMECCVLAQDLCPGSPGADRAAAIAFGLSFGFDKPAETTEEAEQKADGSQTELGVEQQVHGLMKACRLLMNEGLHEQAAELARQAYALDPERVMADPLIYKMHLLADKPAKPSRESSEDCEPPSCPYRPGIGKPIPGIVPEKKESKSGPTTLLVPPLPPVDYEVVPVLDRVLTESAKKSEPADAEEASEEETSSSLQELIETIMDGASVDADGGLRLSGEWSCGSNVYHLRYNRGCLAIWKTPDAAKVKP